jgi:CBS domain-containing protein
MATIRNHFVRPVLSLEASATCGDAARLMAERGIGSVGVHAGGQLVGLVTDRDLVGAVARGADTGRTSLADVMRADLPVVAPDATDVECAQLMRTARTRHLLVREGGRIAGVLSLLDLVDLVVEEKQAGMEQLEAYIRGGRARELSQPTVTVFHHELA